MNKSSHKQNSSGAAMMLFVIFFMVASVSLMFAISRSVYADLVQFRLAYDSKQSYLTADAGIEDAAYRYIADLSIDATEVIELAGAFATTTSVFDSVADVLVLTSSAEDNGAYRSSQMELSLGFGASFNFGVQTGNGGFELTNGSSVTGNVFSNGSVRKTGGGNATIYGDVISAGPSGLIEDVVTTGSAWAHVIRDSTIGGNAYAYTIDDGSVAGGAQYFQKINGAVISGSPEISGVVLDDQEPANLPISDAQIDLMKQDIADNGTIISAASPQCSSGTYAVNSNITLGMVKIECNFEVTKQGAGTTLTLTGPIWVTGNITFRTGPNVVAHSSVGNRTVPIIADNEANRITSSRISVQNGTTFTGTGLNKSYILLISQNEDAETGGAANVDAITLGQSSSGDLLAYAAHGRITLANSIELNEVTAYRIRLGNNADVIYESGLVNLLFTSGPGGGFTIGAWREIE